MNNKQESRIYNSSNDRPVTFIGSSAVEVTPSDSTMLAPGALYVGGGGDIVVKLIDNTSTVTFVGVPTGMILPILVEMVYTTGTDATDMLILR